MDEDYPTTHPVEQVIDEEHAHTFQAMANSHRSRLAVPRSSNFSRQQVIDAFTNSFELIGGIPRLATWAHTHETEFYKLFAKLLPSSAIKEIAHKGDIHVVHTVAPGPLDKDYSPTPQSNPSNVIDLPSPDDGNR